MAYSLVGLVGGLQQPYGLLGKNGRRLPGIASICHFASGPLACGYVLQHIAQEAKRIGTEVHDRAERAGSSFIHAFWPSRRRPEIQPHGEAVHGIKRPPDSGIVRRQ